MEEKYPCSILVESGEKKWNKIARITFISTLEKSQKIDKCRGMFILDSRVAENVKVDFVQ